MLDVFVTPLRQDLFSDGRPVPGASARVMCDAALIHCDEPRVGQSSGPPRTSAVQMSSAAEPAPSLPYRNRNGPEDEVHNRSALWECIYLTPMRVRRLPPEVQAFLDSEFENNDQKDDLGTDWLGRMVGALADASSLPAVRSALKELGLTHSASTWRDIKEKRLKPELEAGRIDRALVQLLLQELEEHGPMHVLLFRLQGSTSRDRARRAQECFESAKRTFDPEWDAASSPDAPVSTKLVHVRIENGSLVAKALETKDSYRDVGGFQITGGREIRCKYRRRARRVKMARLHPDGLLEVRVGALAQEDRRVPYSDEALQFLQLMSPVLATGQFEPVFLDALQTTLWARDKTRDENIFVLDQTLATDEGNTMALRAGSRAHDASRDQTLRLASKEFLGRAGSSLRQAKILWVGQGEDSLPALDFTVRVADEKNEFFTTRACSKADYEQVFSDIRRLGRL